MRYGVFSDVHGNLEGLKACLERFKQEGVDCCIFCGDLIGYGPDPEACVTTVSKLKDCIGVMGNHDAVFLEPGLEAYFNNEALRALEYSKKQLTEKSVRFISRMATVYQGLDFTVVHGAPLDPLKEYFSSCLQFKMNYDLWKGKVCFVGHTHLPFYIEGNQKDCSIVVSKQEDLTIALDESRRYVINPGSVGKPRDGDTRASFGIWDTDAQTFRFLRHSYDVSKTQKKMLTAKLPAFLVDSLSLGI